MSKGTNNEPMKIELLGYSVLDKTVRKGTETSGRVHVPIAWIGKRVKVILQEPVDSE